MKIRTVLAPTLAAAALVLASCSGSETPTSHAASPKSAQPSPTAQPAPKPAQPGLAARPSPTPQPSPMTPQRTPALAPSGLLSPTDANIPSQEDADQEARQKISAENADDELKKLEDELGGGGG